MWFTTGCTTVNYAANAANVAAQDPQELQQKVGARHADATGCTGERRVAMFVRNLPPVSAWIYLNNLWISRLDPKFSAPATKDIDACVGSPYGGGT
jgi:hypothetical protein